MDFKSIEGFKMIFSEYSCDDIFIDKQRSEKMIKYFF